MRGLHIPQNVKCELLDWSEVVAGERSALGRWRRSRSQRVLKYFLGPTRPATGARVLAIWTDHAPRGASAKGIFGAGDENTGAACLTPDALVARRRRTVVVVARDELALVDPQFTVEEMQLFYAR